MPPIGPTGAASDQPGQSAQSDEPGQSAPWRAYAASKPGEPASPSGTGMPGRHRRRSKRHQQRAKRTAARWLLIVLFLVVGLGFLVLVFRLVDYTAQRKEAAAQAQND